MGSKKLLIPSFVLIRETIEKFGYNPNELFGVDSHKLLMVCKCDVCDNIYDSQYASCLSRYKKNKKCKFCSNKENAINSASYRSELLMKKVENGTYIPPMLGKNHSTESIRKMSENRKGISFVDYYGLEKANEIKRNLSIKNTGINNPFYGRSHTEETKQILREHSIRNTRRGKNSNFYGKKYWPNRKLFNYNNIKCRSSWEVKAIIYFNKNDIKFEYEPSIFELSNETTYTPDFYLTELNKYIEVKGYWYEDAKEKFNNFINEYPNIEVEIWDSNKLKEMNII